MEIRPAKATEIDTIADLIMQSDAGVLAMFTGGRSEVLAAIIRLSAEDPKILFSYKSVLVAEEGGKILGVSFNYDFATLKASKFATAQAMAKVLGIWNFLCLLPKLISLGGATRFQDDELYVSNTCILRELRGRGIGGAIMEYQEGSSRYPKIARDVGEYNAKWWRHLLKNGYTIAFDWYFGGKKYFRLVKRLRRNQSTR